MGLSAVNSAASCDTIPHMKDSDPRSMPPEVRVAYRKPIELLHLLKTDIYSDRDRVAVRDDLMRVLVERHGDPWVQIGEGKGEQPFSRRVKAFRKNTVRGIELALSLEDFGGPEATMPLLARAMQPGWFAWWHGLDWKNSSSAIKIWRHVSEHVIGERQFAWLAAQYARSVLDLTRAEDRSMCLRSIEAAEAWARSPSAAAIQECAWAASAIADTSNYYIRFMNLEAASNASSAAVNAAMTCLGPSEAAAYAHYTASRAADSMALGPAVGLRGVIDFRPENRQDIARRLCDLTKSLIEPSLVIATVGPSGRLSASSAALPMAIGAALGAALGAAAVHLSKRA